ncbi:MAG: hypothetical protein A2626_00810 [Candidatus Nealsonbacteria bacterium RIFCSPHIGHO2_01_FULL_38_55]|uniref:Helix-turn-helix domain-containing protein n=2 Tax=Candidatus Nealsoniibacteriota TaxID=1817911 RepID=A0A1G2EJR4_9BACT|nr:MAG: hypothetical protein US88_C0003G0042 [Parcubacteria group bacterium GW2011_GWA2_38_27]KKQ98493.1 MAG: hypothetical protein UT22_C0002G0028 [Parcubacteria group bacterium GW2011_GWC2_39_11]OGZ19959.1 MAG: hypothetical protein A2626_00810 [Candidatus Nealsonbacteria bacterium RIFCSPHIGHO2_01_FULL_38_55]OGZ20551.1 MAG: hypothetical protein A2W55_01980 [Candidatus Nealsonbacteria bacterium RIFCSPHIGHO2_02_38_10]OGZ22021.1 MAG: hypothetical protein A3C48_03380 [Candidatus Nealsonbacteria bac
MAEIKPNEVYTTEEARYFLKVSESTIKRYLKQGIIKAYKVGGRYKILGREILRLVSPKTEKKGEKFYLEMKNKIKKVIERW